MRTRVSLILDEALLAQIDEIAGEKPRRAAVIEIALREFIDREKKKGGKKPNVPAAKKAAAAPRVQTKKG